MRSAITAHLDAGGAGLDPDVRSAVEVLRKAWPNNFRSALFGLDRNRGPCRDAPKPWRRRMVSLAGIISVAQNIFSLVTKTETL